MKSVLAIGLCRVAMRTYADRFPRAEGQRILDSRSEPVALCGRGLGGRVLQKDDVLPLGNRSYQPVIPRRIQASIDINRIAEFHTVATTGGES